MERKGIDLQARLHGYARRDIETFGEYLSAIEVCKIQTVSQDFHAFLGTKQFSKDR